MQRSKGTPPPWVQVGERRVAYAVGPLQAWLQGLISGAPTSTHTAKKAKADDIAGLDEPIRPGGKRKTPKQQTFTAFLTGGMASDEWPFMLVGESRRPVDFIAALLADTDLDDADDECLWLTLEDFAFHLGDAARFEQAQAERAAMDKAFPAGKPVRTFNPL